MPLKSLVGSVVQVALARDGLHVDLVQLPLHRLVLLVSTLGSVILEQLNFLLDNSLLVDVPLQSFRALFLEVRQESLARFVGGLVEHNADSIKLLLALFTLDSAVTRVVA